MAANESDMLVLSVSYSTRTFSSDLCDVDSTLDGRRPKYGYLALYKQVAYGAVPGGEYNTRIFTCEVTAGER
ncbi:hypothetical protein J6590_015593 [Homalodisca vitripennis]|nr:hypothetical protein J6590_015593 [Homalodisca vitripennis]